MADAESTRIAAEYAANLKSLELLFDYTKFHIGLYLTLAGSYITIATVKIGESPVLQLRRGWLWAAMAGFMIAGLAGGVIVSSITQCLAANAPGCVNSAQFLDRSIGPWDWTTIHFPGRVWTYIEHTSFWLGLLSAVASFVERKTKPNNGMQATASGGA